MSTNLFMFFVATFIAATLLFSIMDGTTGIATTTLTSAVASTDTSISVHRTQGFPTSGVLIMNAETVCYGSVTATTFTDLTRGCRDTSASDHSILNGGQQLKVYSQAPGLLNTLVGFDIASGFAGGGFIGTFTGVWEGLKHLPDFVAAIAKMVMWDYRTLDNDGYVYMKFLILYPLSAGMVLSFVRMLMGR